MINQELRLADVIILGIFAFAFLNFTSNNKSVEINNKIYNELKAIKEAL